MFDSDCRSHGGSEGKFVALAIFLLILFAIFRGRGFGGGCDDYAVAGGNRLISGPADFWAASGLAQAVPGFQAQNFTQQAINFGALSKEISQGNFAISQQMTDTAHRQENLFLVDKIAELRNANTLLNDRLLQQETINKMNEKFCDVGGQLCEIRNNMLTKPPVQAVAGLPHLQCTNFPFPHNFGGVGSGCGC